MSENKPILETMKAGRPTYSSLDLPKEIPLFPLAGVVLLPHGQLPLNIFEERYIALFDDALRDNRIIGMIQPQEITTGLTDDDALLFKTGCAGRITAFEETGDGRYMVTLTGLCRFRLLRELPMKNGYRRAVPDWTRYYCDLGEENADNFDRTRLESLLENYFDMHGLECDWRMIGNTCNEKLITVLSMVCPLDYCEKQALLEADCCYNRARLFMDMLEMALHGERLHDCSAIAH